jgi:hypothetical protein
MGEAIDRVRAMAEGEHGGRRHETERGKGREQDRDSEAQAGGKRGQHE